jgi:hypothetical protein
MDWTGNTYVIKINTYRISAGETLKEEDHLKDLVVDGRMILKWMFKNWMECIGFLWCRIWPRG